jgi:hypothetical protein
MSWRDKDGLHHTPYSPKRFYVLDLRTRETVAPGTLLRKQANDLLKLLFEPTGLKYSMHLDHTAPTLDQYSVVERESKTVVVSTPLTKTQATGIVRLLNQEVNNANG